MPILFFGWGCCFFTAINIYRFSPSFGDNNKFFLYFHLIASFFVAHALSALWRDSRAKKALALALLIITIGPIFLEWGVRLSRGHSTLFTECDFIVGRWIRKNTPPNAVFLSADTQMHLVPAIGGRRVVNGAYTWNTGVKEPDIEQQVERAFATGNTREVTSVPVTHMIVSPQEQSRFSPSLELIERWNQPILQLKCNEQQFSVYTAGKTTR